MREHVTISRKSVKDDHLWNYLNEIAIHTGNPIKDCIKNVCEFLEIEPILLMSNSRQRRLVEGRQFLSWTCINILNACGKSELGNQINRDHASIIHNIGTFKRDYKQNARFAYEYNSFLEEYYPERLMKHQKLMEVYNG